METGVDADKTNGWLVFADPFHFDPESVVAHVERSLRARCPCWGGLASGDLPRHRRNSTQLYLNGDVLTEGGVAISIGGDVKLQGIISQGCTPIGEPWTLTRVDGQFIHEIANRPAYEVLTETFNALSAEEQRKSRGNLLIGLVSQ